MNEDFLAAFNALERDRQKTFLDQLLQNLQLSGGISSIENEMVDGYGYGGRVGYSVPMDSGMLMAGIKGAGSRLKTPKGKSSTDQVTGADISYKFGPNMLSLMYDKYGMIPTRGVEPLPNEMPLKDLVRLIYSREF